MFIFVILFHIWMCRCVLTCEIETETTHYHTCLGQWTLINRFSQYGHTGFLKDPSLMDDICIRQNGVNVEEMDTCVKQNVSPLCDSIITNWSGLKEFVKFLCKHRETFYANECRRKAGFQDNYLICMSEDAQTSTNHVSECRKKVNTRLCLDRALRKHCSKTDRKFFQVAFNNRDLPNELYACKMGHVRISEEDVEHIHKENDDRRREKVSKHCQEDHYNKKVLKAEVVYLSADGNPLQLIALDVDGLDINVLSEWFTTSSFLLSGEPLDADVQLQDRSGNNEFIVGSSTNGEMGAIVYHEDNTVNPRIMLAVNSSSSMQSSTTSSLTGCYADWELDFTLSFTDAVSITVAACLSSCTTNYAALRSADKCYCVEFKSQVHNMDPNVYCTLTCPGDGESCGGVADGYFSVYSGTVQNNLNTLTVSQEALLTVTHTGGSQHVIPITDELTTQGWVDKTLYFNGVAVDATNTSGHRVSYSIEFSQDLVNFTSFQSGNQFVSDGTVIDTDMRLEGAVMIVYDQPVDIASIMLYGPPASSFVDVQYLAISVHFEMASSTPAPSSSAPPSTSAVSELYNVFPNMSILINGTLYCPCNETNGTFYPPLDSIYDNTNLTFEERLDDMTVDADALSSNTRRYESAKDDRPSSATMGTFGILVIVSTVSFIVYLDSQTLVAHAKRLKKNIQILRRNCETKTRVQSIHITNGTGTIYPDVKNDPDISKDPDDIPIPDILK